MHLYLSTNAGPRTLLLLSRPPPATGGTSKALVLRAPERKGSLQAIVELLDVDEVELREYRILEAGREIGGVLGLVAVGNDMFLAVIVASVPLPPLLPNQPVRRILSVAFHSLTTSTFDTLPIDPQTGFPLPPTADPSEYQPDGQTYYATTSVAGAGAYEPHPCAALRKLVEAGTFYYADGLWDITTRLAERVKRRKRGAEDWEACDERFVWNMRLAEPLLEWRKGLREEERRVFDECRFLVLAIQGAVIVHPLPSAAAGPATLALISRLSWKRAGTRFNARGIDDDGEVANFVETETLFSTPSVAFSYLQVRGSIPLFWEQQGMQAFGQKIQITRPYLAAQPAFERHFLGILELYHAIHVLNLLGQKETEAVLTASYTQHLSALARGATSTSDVSFDNLDFHAVVRMLGHEGLKAELRRLGGVRSRGEEFGWTTVDLERHEVVMRQNGVFRTNCLDCLDRTNFVQDILSRWHLEDFLSSIHSPWGRVDALWGAHRHLWAENGDALSRIYAGTGALNTSYTRTGRKTLAGMFSDATKSISRAYVNNVTDKSKQVAIDMFLGNLSSQRPVTIFDPINDSIRAALHAKLPEYSTTRRVNVLAGTYNLNGQVPTESLLPWLFPNPSEPEPDIIALAFQEIVQLTPQQIMNTDPEKRRIWEKFILDTLEMRADKKSEYLILRSEQLVGLALILLVKQELSSKIRVVEGTTKKTGLKGMSGNKGAAGIRLQYEDTTFCFLSAHFAAGHSNIEERNNDYWTISQGLHFLKGKTIDSHDNIIWCGDFNYRIDLPYERAVDLAQRDEYSELHKHDQLQRARATRGVFAGYEEAPMRFRPTYRFDNGTDTYDTSEKRRIPAWTDRILYRGENLELKCYASADLRASDHRPVYGTLSAEIRIIDKAKREALARQLHDDLVKTQPGEVLDEKLKRLALSHQVNGADPAPQLPPPSEDIQNWWSGPDRSPAALVARALARPPVLSDPFDDSDDEWDKPSLPSPTVPEQRRKPPAPPIPLASKPVVPRKPAGLAGV